MAKGKKDLKWLWITLSILVISFIPTLIIGEWWIGPPIEEWLVANEWVTFLVFTGSIALVIVSLKRSLPTKEGIMIAIGLLLGLPTGIVFCTNFPQHIVYVVLLTVVTIVLMVGYRQSATKSMKVPIIVSSAILLIGVFIAFLTGTFHLPHSNHSKDVVSKKEIRDSTNLAHRLDALKKTNDSLKVAVAVNTQRRSNFDSGVAAIKVQIKKYESENKDLEEKLDGSPRKDVADDDEKKAAQKKTKAASKGTGWGNESNGSVATATKSSTSNSTVWKDVTSSQKGWGN